MIYSLLPKIIENNNSSYQSVEDLSEALNLAIKEERLCNIALTVSFGIGNNAG